MYNKYKPSISDPALLYPNYAIWNADGVQTGRGAQKHRSPRRADARRAKSGVQRAPLAAGARGSGSIPRRSSRLCTVRTVQCTITLFRVPFKKVIHSF